MHDIFDCSQAPRPLDKADNQRLRLGQTPLHRHSPSRAEVWQQRGEQADERQIRADLEDEGDAVLIGDGTEHGGADPAEAESEPEEKAGHRADFAGNERKRSHTDEISPCKTRPLKAVELIRR